MSFTYRKATMADREKYLDFANLVFSNAHRPHDFQALIPKVYGEGRDTAHMQNIAVRDDGSIRGMVAVMPNNVNVMGTALKYGYVGTVSVHPYARGEGHMKKLMAMAIEGAKNDGCDLMMLGGQRQRYEYFGFTRGGVRHSHRITATNLRHVLGDTDVSDIEIAVVCADDLATAAACARLQESDKLYATRTAEEFHLIAGTWFNKLMSVTVCGNFVGYIIGNGEGIDEIKLNDWSLALKVLRRYMQFANVNAVSIGTGDHEWDANREFARLEESRSTSPAEMLLIFNFCNVISAHMKLKASYAPLADGKRSFIIDGEPMTVEVVDGNVTVTSTADADAMSISTMDAQRLFFGFDGELLVGRLPFGWAQLPLYMPHTDAF